jgi:hypothetical protein
MPLARRVGSTDRWNGAGARLTAAAIAAERAPGTIAEQAGVDVRATGSVPDRQDMAATAYHRRFTITDLSSPIAHAHQDIRQHRRHSLRPPAGRPEQRSTAELPAIGTVMPPTGQITFQVAWEYAMDNNVDAYFSDTATGAAA